MKKLLFAVALLLVGAFAVPAQASTCYQYNFLGVCTLWGPTPPANTRAGYNSNPTLASNEVAAYTSTNAQGIGGYFWVAFQHPALLLALG